MNDSEYGERLKTTGRNDPCPCGSGKKYKKCHLAADEAAKHEELAKAAEEREAALSAEDAEAKDDAGKGRNPLPRKDDHRHAGKARGGKDSHANIPRRGAV